MTTDLLRHVPAKPEAGDNVAPPDPADFHLWYPACPPEPRNVAPTYNSRGTQSDRRYSNNSERHANVAPVKTAQVNVACSAYREWEHHDSTTMREIMPESDESGNQDGVVFETAKDQNEAEWTDRCDVGLSDQRVTNTRVSSGILETCEAKNLTRNDGVEGPGVRGLKETGSVRDSLCSSESETNSLCSSESETDSLCLSESETDTTVGHTETRVSDTETRVGDTETRVGDTETRVRGKSKVTFPLNSFCHDFGLSRGETASKHINQEPQHSSCDASRNGGVYDPFRPALSLLASSETMHLLCLPPAAKYRDLVALRPVGSTPVAGLESSRRYKNNLAGVLSFEGALVLVVACGSELLAYRFGPLGQLPEEKPCLRFDTRPPFTLALHQAALTWPYFPHTINALKVCELWLDGPAVGVCVDDGAVLVWHAKTLFREIHKLVLGAGLYRMKIAADVCLLVSSSAWGIDFASAAAGDAKRHLLAVSSNSHDITLFVHHHGDNFHLVVSQPILHNIPEVSFVSYTVECGTHRALVCAPSISGELVMFDFSFRTSSPTEFDTPTVVGRTNLGADGWTAKPVHSCHFKPVQSLRAMTGDPSIDELVEMSHILVELALAQMAVDPRKSSAVGGAARWQFFDSPVVSLSNEPDLLCSSKFADFDTDHELMHAAFQAQCQENMPQPPTAPVLLAVSTETRLGLFSADTMFCHAATKKLFTVDIPATDETRWCDRILLTLVIPELLSFVAASQAGLVSIMRLCQHRGLYGMRQEHLFPNVLAIAVAEDRIRTIVGLCARDVSVAPEYPRFCLYVVYSDGLVLTYELSTEV